LAKTKSTWKKLKQRSVGARRGLDLIVSEVEDLSSSTAPDAISACTVLEEEIRAWTETTTGLHDRVERVFRQLQGERTEQIETLEQSIARELRFAGHTVFGATGLLIVDGTVHVDVDLKKSRVTVNDVSIDDLNVTSITAKVLEELERLRMAITPPGQMLERLAEAYDREVRSSGVNPGTQVQTTALLLQLALMRQAANFRGDPSARNYREYPRVLFRADLHTLLVSGESSVRSMRFRYASGADTAGAIFMLVPALGRTAHIGRIWFEVQGAADK
jgi:hypothetical protein